MRHTLPIAPQFYVTAPQPCPYLAGRFERKLFTALSGEQAKPFNNTLSKQGFRRSQNVLYRPACSECTSCLSARIRVADFKPTRTQRKTMARNRHLKREATSPWATDEQFSLFRRYLDQRHADGGMADMDQFEFAAMIEETPVRTRVIEYTDKAGDVNADSDITVRGDGSHLVGVCLTDVLDDGLSLVYSFFEPKRAGDSLGTYIILDHINLAREVGLPYVYLGYWVPGSPKMAYKARFAPLEVYRDGQWVDVGKAEDYDAFAHPLSVKTITEQVAAITLPPEANDP